MAHDTRASEREFRVQAMETRVANQQATVKLVNTMSDEDVKNQISTLKQNQSGSLKWIHIIEVVGVQPEEGVLARLHGCWLIWRSEVEIASLMRAAGLPPSVAPPDATPRPTAKRPCCCRALDLAGCCWSNWCRPAQCRDASGADGPRTAGRGRGLKKIWWSADPKLEKPLLPGCKAVVSKTMAASLERIFQIMSSWYEALCTISQYKHWNIVLAAPVSNQAMMTAMFVWQSCISLAK